MYIVFHESTSRIKLKQDLQSSVKVTPIETLSGEKATNHTSNAT